jgi:dipeptidyl aminopeptidase/acylaminoacyl peptidase
VWLLPVGGGEAEKITDLKGGVEDFAWSPNSAQLALVVHDVDPRAPDPAAKEKKTVPPLVLDRFQFKKDKSGYLTEVRSHLRLLTLATRKVEPLTSGKFDNLSPAWSPDGREIAFLSKRGADPDRTDEWSLLAIAPSPGSAERVIAKFPQLSGFAENDNPFTWSPDGQTIAFIHGNEPKLIEYGARALAVVPSAGGTPRLLTAALDRNVSSPRWAADGKSLLAIVEDDGAETLQRIPLAGGAPETIVGGRRRINSFDLARDGRVVVLTATPERPPEVFAAEAATLRPLSKQNDALFAGLRLGRVEETKFKSADGTEIHGFIVHPVDAPPAGTRPPALLRLHGGPASQYAAAFDFEKQLFAANGYLVILPNPRGSTGRGTDFSKAIFADWGHRDVEDDLAAVDDAIARGLTEESKLGVGGWSYGGMSTNYLIATTTRFKAATSGASISNVMAGYGTDQYVRDYHHELGTPWQNPDTWQRISFPFLHADRIKTPTLFLCGEKDFNVPLLNSEQMYQALQSLGVPTQLVVYPGQFHGLSKPSYLLDRFNRYLAWYAKYLPAAKPAVAATN